MAHFFFDTHSDRASFRDLDGLELASLDMAREEMIRALPGMLRDELPIDVEGRDIKADIRDDAGRIIFTAHLSLTAKWVD